MIIIYYKIETLAIHLLEMFSKEEGKKTKRALRKYVSVFRCERILYTDHINFFRKKNCVLFHLMHLTFNKERFFSDFFFLQRYILML